MNLAINIARRLVGLLQAIACSNRLHSSGPDHGRVGIVGLRFGTATLACLLLSMPFLLGSASRAEIAEDSLVPRTQSGALSVAGRRASQSELVRLGIPGDAQAITVIDLASVPLDNFPDIRRRGGEAIRSGASFEVFQGDVRFRPAQWPKQGYERTFRRGAEDDEVQLTQADWARWGSEPFLWIGGYWIADWAFETSRVVGRNEAVRTLKVQPPRGTSKIRDGFPHFVFNAFGALTQPGEYVLDPVAHKLYAFGFGDNRSFEVAVRETLIDLDEPHDLHLTGLHLEKTAGTALRIRNGRNITIDGCVIRHVGNHAIVIEGGSNVTITNCLIEDTAEMAIWIAGGDRATLTPGGHVVKNTVIRNFGVDSRTYRPAVQMTGDGNRIENSTIENGPHSAIIVQGNDHVIRGNSFRNVVREADDAGAIYTGRDWTERGTVIADNLFEEIGMADAPEAAIALGRKFVSAIYLDDSESGFAISHNVFYRVSRPIAIHGGRDNQIVGNAFLRCDRSGIWLGLDEFRSNDAILQQRLKAMPYQGSRWAQRFPALARILDEHPYDPIGNSEQDNIAVGCQLFSFRSDTSASFWPLMGKSSHEVPAPAEAYGALELIRRAGRSCKDYPILCQPSKAQ